MPTSAEIWDLFSTQIKNGPVLVQNDKFAYRKTLKKPMLSEQKLGTQLLLNFIAAF